MQYLVKAPATSIMMELWWHTTHFIMTGSFFISSKATMWNIIQLQYIASYISLLSRKRKLFSWAINYYISYDHDVKLKTLFEGYLALFSTAVASLLFCEYTSSGDSSKHWKSWPSPRKRENRSLVPEAEVWWKTLKTQWIPLSMPFIQSLFGFNSCMTGSTNRNDCTPYHGLCQAMWGSWRLFLGQWKALSNRNIRVIADTGVSQSVIAGQSNNICVFNQLTLWHLVASSPCTKITINIIPHQPSPMEY